jgi:hypothetical protein
METSDRYLTLDEVARQVHLTNSGSVLRYLRDGRLRGVLRSRYHGWQVTQADVDEFNAYVNAHGTLPPVGWASPVRAKDRRAHTPETR